MSKIRINYGSTIESSLKKIEDHLKTNYTLSKRSIGLFLLQEDPEIIKLVKQQEEKNYKTIERIVKETKSHYGQPLNYVITMKRDSKANQIISRILTPPLEVKINFRERLSRFMMRPLTGIPLFLIVLYFGLYLFVGVFGAQILVDFLEETIFGTVINPFVTELVKRFIPYILIQDLLVGEYGIFTLGVRYAIALILPIVGTFFIAFSILEDTGYLPRLAMLIDRIFKRIGLNGRAVIPMILGLGCATMATIVTRTLETRRERIISTLLLALAIPCSAQLGVILGLLAGKPTALLIWGGIVAGMFLLVGFLFSRIMPGDKPTFYMEVPPLRMPKISNVLMKTYTRLEWYFMEVFPLFIIASILIWLGQLTGVFQLIIGVLEPVVTLIGLPKETAVAFLFGFFRRDYGVAGLFDLQTMGLLSGTQLVVAAVSLTLFLPCIAQFSIIIKERGVKTAAAIALFILPFAFLVGFLTNLSLISLGVQL